MTTNLSILRSLSIALLVLITTQHQPAVSAPANNAELKLKIPPKRQTSKKVAYPPAVDSNTLLIMPNKGDAEDALQKIREVNGTIVRTVGRGELTTWVVEFENPEKFLKAEKQLVNDKHFKKMQRNYTLQPDVVNDPYYAAQENCLGWLRIEGAWSRTLGSASGPGGTIGVIDTGVSSKNLDLFGKLLPGYDCNKNKEKQKDTGGHGSLVATTAAALGNNSLLTAGPARLCRVFPVNAYKKKIGSFPTDNLLDAIDQASLRGVRILNLSLNARPGWTLANRNVHPVLNDYMEAFHNGGGLIFNSAGNTYADDGTTRKPYLIVVSAIDSEGYLAGFSTHGNSTWFTAPGTFIPCSDKKGKFARVSGTSFSCPLTAAVAALVWGAKPSLTNTAVEQVLKNTARNAAGLPNPNIYYGYGVPDAAAAVNAVLP